MKQKMTVMKVGQLLLCSGLAVVVVGCAAPAAVAPAPRVEPTKPAEPTPVASLVATRKVTAIPSMRETITIRAVSGSKDTNPLWASKVSSSEFEGALEASLKNAGLLSPNRQGSKYVLIASLGKLDQSAPAPNAPATSTATATATATASVRYSLLDGTSNLEVFDRSLVTPYTVAAADGFSDAEQLKLAHEGAVRANIQQLMDALAALKVPRVAGQVAK